MKRALVVLPAVVVALACAHRDAPSSIQRRHMQKYRPVAIEGGPRTEPGPIVDLKVRVWADAGYRSEKLRWREKVSKLFFRVNQVTEAAFRVRLVLDDVREWDRPGGDPELGITAQALVHQDPGEDVDWVIGLTTAMPAVEESVHKLGIAHLLSKHFVLRAMNDVAEAQAIERVFPALPRKERMQLYVERVQHKEVSIFLHEWAHTLGAMHTASPSDIMHPSYNAQQSAFSEPNARIIRVSLSSRGDPEAQAKALLELVTAQQGPWDPREREDMIRQLEAIRDRAKVAKEEAAEPKPGDAFGDRIPPAAAAAFREADALARRGKIDEAWALVEEHVGLHPNHHKVQRLACWLASTMRQAPVAALDTCRHASRLDPTDPEPSILLARALFRVGNREDALVAVEEARRRLEARDEAGGEGRKNLGGWNELAGVYYSLDMVSYAEQAARALADTTRGQELLDWATRTRRRTALPPDAGRFGITPDKEPEYFQIYWAIYRALNDADLAAARRLIERGQRRFKNAPGFHQATCEIHLRMKLYKQALSACQRTVKLYEEAARAQYLLGIVHLRLGKHAPAARHLERSLELAPEVRTAWTYLADAYERLGQPEKVRSLEDRYRTTFGQPLPR